MTLADTIAALVVKSDQLTETVSGLSESWDAKVTDALNAFNATIAAWGYGDGETVVRVGPTRQFATVQAAVNEVRRKQVRGVVTIKVDDGTYTMSRLDVSDMPYACGIRIIGNEDVPANVQIVFAPAGADTLAQGIVAIKSPGVYFSGMALRGQAWTTCLQLAIARDNSAIYINSPKVILSDALRGLVAYRGGVIVAPGVTITGCLRPVFADASGTIDLDQGATLTARGRTASAANAQGVVEATMAGVATGGGVLIARRANVSGTNVGFRATGNGVVIATAATISDADAAVIAENGGYVDVSTWTDQTGTASSLMTNVRLGGLASYGGRINGKGSRVGQVGVAGLERGFGAIYGGQVFVDGSGVVGASQFGYVAEALSFISALSTTANCSGNATNYSLANATVGAAGSVIYSS
jgi:hypothetical protein